MGRSVHEGFHSLKTDDAHCLAKASSAADSALLWPCCEVAELVGDGIWKEVASPPMLLLTEGANAIFFELLSRISWYKVMSSYGLGLSGTWPSDLT